MKASIMGGDGNILCQVPALRKAFSDLGHTHTSDVNDHDSAFLFVGNAPFDSYLNVDKKKIFNVLDIPFHLPEVDSIITSITEASKKCHKVTVISKAVQEDLKKYCDIDAELIHYPMKPVSYTGQKKYPYKVLMAGRLRDPNKFAASAIHAIQKAGFEQKDLVIVGPDDIGMGNYLGIVDDETLNDLYNSVDFVVMLDRFAGLGLPAIEAACCGAIPIVAAHLHTLDDVWAQSPLGLHYHTCKSIQGISDLMNGLKNNDDWRNQVKKDLLVYADSHLRPRYEAKHVIDRILRIYHSIHV